MAGSIETRLAAAGITLPTAAAPVANYVPTVLSGNLLYISGQLPMVGGKPSHVGHLGDDVDVAAGQAAARNCAINLLAALRAALGSLNRVRNCVRLGGFVNCDPLFPDVPKVINGASDLMHEVFGADGAHARTAVGVASLPRGAAVEVEAIFALRA